MQVEIEAALIGGLAGGGIGAASSLVGVFVSQALTSRSLRSREMRDALRRFITVHSRALSNLGSNPMNQGGLASAGGFETSQTMWAALFDLEALCRSGWGKKRREIRQLVNKLIAQHVAAEQLWYDGHRLTIEEMLALSPQELGVVILGDRAGLQDEIARYVAEGLLPAERQSGG